MTYYRILFLQIFVFLHFSLGYQHRTHSEYLRNTHDPLTRTTEVYQDNVTQNNTGHSVVQIKVYYETLCPASVDFFTSQLRPTVEKLAKHLDVHLIPYGHAQTWQVRGRYRFRCQHGPAECYGNALHACAVDALQNTTQAVLFNACLMQYAAHREDVGYDYVSALNWCGFKLNTLIHGIWQCVNSERGSVLLKGYGDETRELSPQYVPYVVLDGSVGQQNEATGNLMATICHKLPATVTACYGY